MKIAAKELKERAEESLIKRKRKYRKKIKRS